MVVPRAATRRSCPSLSRTRVLALNAFDPLAIVPIEPGARPAGHGRSVSGADRIGLAIQPRLDLRDPIPPLTSDVNGSRAAIGGAQVVDGLRSDADTISRDVSRPPVMERCVDAKHTTERHLWPISGR
ncbi:MAG TPA: hypothetical protein VGO88_04225 [Mycetocola sp.]|nr:hypothetical protein [Mycetocola sp.]